METSCEGSARTIADGNFDTRCPEHVTTSDASISARPWRMRRKNACLQSSGNRIELIFEAARLQGVCVQEVLEKVVRRLSIDSQSRKVVVRLLSCRSQCS